MKLRLSNFRIRFSFNIVELELAFAFVYDQIF